MYHLVLFKVSVEGRAPAQGPPPP